jgi:hypothetical protein
LQLQRRDLRQDDIAAIKCARYRREAFYFSRKFDWQGETLAKLAIEFG